MQSFRLFRSIIIAILVISAAFVGVTQAKVGVGMGAGEVRLTEPVKLGGIYELPALRIFNTGDEVTTYGMNIAFHQDRPELRPKKEWFSFSPSTFTVEPNQSQLVEVTMQVPLKSEPGEYFAFIESGPVAKNEPGTSVGIAVATKLFFNVEPANVWQAMAIRTGALLKTYAPWSWIAIGIILFIILILVLRKYFSFSIGVKRG